MREATSLLVAPIGLTGRPDSVVENGDRPLAVGDEAGLLHEIRSAADSGADLILLPQLSFSPYFPAGKDREALELGERFPSAKLAAARDSAGDSWLAASGYECVGEGVFHVRGELGTAADGCLLAERQHQIEASPGRYEQMFFSPGYGRRSVVETPWGKVALLIGADVREVAAWQELSGLGAKFVVAAVSEGSDGWKTVCRAAAGLSTVHEMALALVNRAAAADEPDFVGGSLILDATGNTSAADERGLFRIQLTDSQTVGSV